MFDISKIRIVYDFPTPGIKFLDITTLLNDGEEFRKVIDTMLAIVKEIKPEVIVALEARGYFFGPVLAYELGIPFVPIRKKGKLPSTTYAESYDLEYGTATMEIHTDAMKEGQHVLLLDDVLATGGTITAAANLVERFNPASIDMLFLMEIVALKGRDKINKYNIHSLVQL